ncbi:rubredoxin [Candidatus Magnetaquicoccus inordinatus]|uniref:rubredoxin n=1 Tax=Candidatus Magnetaquicoccus inordinatus TaxID=2496818 RepID=UPI00102B4C87|nr:rubredoxin [Candidatus Magnetaquicoccus inordinatus]
MSAEKWICNVCDYLYDPAKGDPESGVVPGTAFAELDEEWLCPDCGARKVSFSLQETTAS